MKKKILTIVLKNIAFQMKNVIIQRYDHKKKKREKQIFFISNFDINKIRKEYYLC